MFPPLIPLIIRNDRSSEVYVNCASSGESKCAYSYFFFRADIKMSPEAVETQLKSIFR